MEFVPIVSCPFIDDHWGQSDSHLLYSPPWSVSTPATFACLPECQDALFFSLEEAILENQAAPLDLSSLQNPLKGKSSLKRPKSSPFKSRVVILLFALLTALRILNSTIARSLHSRLFPAFTSLTCSLFEGIRSSDHHSSWAHQSLVSGRCW